VVCEGIIYTYSYTRIYVQETSKLRSPYCNQCGISLKTRHYYPQYINYVRQQKEQVRRML